MSLSTEERFLRLCLRALWDPPCPEAAVTLAVQEQFDWAALRLTADVERVAALLYHVVCRQGLVPPEVEAALEEAYYGLARQNSLLLHELERIVGALAEAGVPVLLLKGAALAETAYGNAALRPMDDLDVLVPRPQVGAAQAALTGLGYRMVTTEPWPGFSWRYRNAVMLGHPASTEPTFFVGLHIQLFDVPYYERIPVGDWFARAQAVPAAGSGARMPAPEDHLVYLCGHLALHHEREPALLRYVDIALLIRYAGEALDWEQVVQRTADWRLVIPLQRTLAALEDLWPGVVPSAVAAQVARLQAGAPERRLHAWLAGHGRTPAFTVLLALATLPGLGRRAGYLLEQAFPSPAYMRRRYCPERPGLWPLMYLRRVGLAFAYLLARRY